MLEQHNGPDHLVVFITSDQDFGEKIQELQRRKFKVAVIYNGPAASRRPASIVHAADESYDWLDFLKQELTVPELTLSAYNSAIKQPGSTPIPHPAPPIPSKPEPTGKVNTAKVSHSFSCNVLRSAYWTPAGVCRYMSVYSHQSQL